MKKRKVKSKLFNKLQFKYKGNLPFRCHSGPWDGKIIYLETGCTLEFTLNGQRGSYKLGVWHKS